MNDPRQPCVLTIRDGLDGWCEGHRRYHCGHTRQYALGTDAVSVGYRIRWTVVAEGMAIDPEPERGLTIPYTLAQAVAEYAKTTARHVAGGRKMVPAEIRAVRRGICDGCQYRDQDHDSCRICHCNLSPSELQSTILGDKLSWAVASCPVDKWGEWIPQ